VFKLTTTYITILIKHHNFCQGRPLLLLAPGARNLPMPLISTFRLNIRSEISVLGYETLNVLILRILRDFKECHPRCACETYICWK